jgi:DNA-binding ferritin-like protein (Dps family)
MAVKWIEALTGSLEQKKQYRDAKKRIDALPEPYRSVANAQHRYTMYYGGITDGDILVQIFLDLADLWERASIDGTPVADIVGADPVEFAEAYAQAYGGVHWIDKERARLIKAVDDATKKENRS